MTHAAATTQENFRESAKIALIQRRLSITALAKKMKRPRSSVSRAINGQFYPKLRAKIREALGL